MTWTRWSACHASSTCETSPRNPAWSAKGFQTTGVQVKAEGDLTLISVGFGGVKETTVQALASAPASENAFKGNDIQAIMEHFSNLCSVIDSPKPPPSPGPPALPPSPSDPRETPPSAPSPPFAPPSICENTCAYASDGTCDDGGAGSEYDLCTVR